MIKVIVKKNKKDVPYEFNISGHAGYDVSGRDIICSAVSVLAINTINSMQTFCKDKINVNIDNKSATIIIKLPTIKDEIESTELCVLSKSLFLGLTEVSTEYGKRFIEIKEEKQC